MCYAKPGPRCSGHALKALERAVATYGKDSPEARESGEAYLRTPKGIAQLRNSDTPEDQRLAVVYASERKKLVREAKFEHAHRDWERSEGKERFATRVDRRAQLLYGKNVFARVSHNSMRSEDGDGNPLALLEEVMYLESSPSGGSYVIEREYLTNSDALHMDLPREF